MVGTSDWLYLEDWWEKLLEIQKVSMLWGEMMGYWKAKSWLDFLWGDQLALM